jgi:hypothetical protein
MPGPPSSSASTASTPSPPSVREIDALLTAELDEVRSPVDIR